MVDLICSACGHKVPAGSRFCSQCGSPLPEELPVELNPSGREVMLQSLRSLMPQPLVEKVTNAAPEIVGERREVTVLFLDIVNFSATSLVLDGEDVYIWTDRVLRRMSEVIYEYEGTIDKYTGDGVMALFGVPIAHENDPERTLRAAMDMLTALKPLQTQFNAIYNLDFHVRIGIHTGLVIAGRIGSDLHLEYTVIGNTVNLANRLQSIAQPNTIAVSFETYQRTHPLLNFEPLPLALVKGQTHPIRAFRPLSLRLKPGQIRGLPGLAAPMVGRQKALAQMQNALGEMLQDGQTRVLLVTGEAGVGKSRLVEEFHKIVTYSDISFYRGVCLIYTRPNALRLMANLLRDIIQLLDSDSVEVQHAALLTYLDQMELDKEDLVPYLLNVLGLEHAFTSIETRLNRFNPAVLQKLTHSALRQVLLAETHRLPVILVLDDLHWVDPA
ncbi:MAG: zinc-ribbon domain-containing protein, partial [Anaerolineales bacterium]